MRRLVCQCGGRIVGPVPSHCPHCGARIAGVRRRLDLAGPLVVAAMFLALVAFLVWFVR